MSRQQFCSSSLPAGAGKRQERYRDNVELVRTSTSTLQEASIGKDANLADLVMRIRTGERSAEEELVRRYRRSISIIVWRIAKDPFVAEDLSQETFRLVFEGVRRGSLRKAERLSGFICTVARNLAIDHFRRSRRMEFLGELETRAALCHPGPSQLTRLVDRERAKTVRQALKGMKSARDREVLYQLYIAEEEKERICANLGLSHLQLNRVLWRARKRFRKLYESLATAPARFCKPSLQTGSLGQLS